jgi:hypothetical protein
MIYDRKRAPENRDVMTFEEDGETSSAYFLLPRSREDLRRRFETHRRIASWTYGLLGRSPDNFPSYVSGLVMDPAMFDRIRQGFGDNIKNYYRHMRSDDIFCSHTVTNPQGWRNLPAGDARTPPTLRVVGEDDRGVTINGLKMLGTASVFCHETWCGNLQPLAPGQEKESITCVVPLNAPGVSIWSRKPYERDAGEFDNPLAARFDETDSAVLFENVHVPWERVFCHDNVEMTRAIYMRTPGHAMANHQANVRFLEKLKLIVGVAGKLAELNNAVQIPAVQSTLGRLAALQAKGLIMGQINCRRGAGAGLSHRQPPLRLCGTALVYQQSCGDLRHGARADGRRRVPDAGRCVGPDEPADARAVRDLLVGPGPVGQGAHEAVEARLGPARLRLCRAPHAVREVLCRSWLRHERLFLPDCAVEGLVRLGRRIDGELQCAGQLVHQRRTLWPAAKPTSTIIPMARLYHVATNSGESSVQCVA